MATESSSETLKPKRKPLPAGRGKEFGTLTQVFDDLWWTWGTTRLLPGVTIPRNMTIVRENGELVVVHPVMMPAAEQAKIEALGRIRHIVRLGDFHGMDDRRYVEKYGATVWSPHGATPHDGVRVDHELVPGGKTPFADGSLYGFEVASVPELVIHLPRHGGILLTCDSVQNWETRPAGCSWLGSIMTKRLGFQGRACIGPRWRTLCEPRTGINFGPSFRQLLELDFRHFIGAHGPPIEGTAKDDLHAVVDRLYPR